MIRKVAKACAIGLAMWLPFCVLWILFAVSVTHDRLSAILLTSLFSMGSAGFLGIAVWHLCRRFPWPLRFNLTFYALQIIFGLLYSTVWFGALFAIQWIRSGAVPGPWSWGGLLRQLLIGFWYYAVLAGIFYAIQTRIHLHEKESQAARAQALVTAARLDALRALVEFSEEYQFTRQYLAFEQLRFEDRLRVDFRIDPESFNFDVPPFSIQTLAENAVQHAIAIRPEGGSLQIECICKDGLLRVSVRDDGNGEAPEASDSHQFGLRSLRERLCAAYGPSVELRLVRDTEGFEASFAVPSSSNREHVGDYA